MHESECLMFGEEGRSFPLLQNVYPQGNGKSDIFDQNEKDFFYAEYWKNCLEPAYSHTLPTVDEMRIQSEQ